jgi:hypothetical protein
MFDITVYNTFKKYFLIENMLKNILKNFNLIFFQIKNNFKNRNKQNAK